MKPKMGYRWLLRERMADRGLWKTTDLVPLLDERGITLSSTQVYRLVTATPERLSLDVLAAICDALDCAPNDLIEPFEIDVGRRRTTNKAVGDVTELRSGTRPRRARVTNTDT